MESYKHDNMQIYRSLSSTRNNNLLFTYSTLTYVQIAHAQWYYFYTSVNMINDHMPNSLTCRKIIELKVNINHTVGISSAYRWHGVGPHARILLCFENQLCEKNGSNYNYRCFPRRPNERDEMKSPRSSCI